MIAFYKILIFYKEKSYLIEILHFETASLNNKYYILIKENVRIKQKN